MNPERIDIGGLLTIGIFLPLVGAVVIWAAAEAGRRAVRQVALWTSIATLVFVGVVVATEIRGDAAYGPGYHWLGPAAQTGLDIQFSVGLDGLSVWLFGLSALLMVVCVLVSWEAITDRAAAFYALLLILETGMLGVFAARDVILFYVFFEFTLIPLFFLVGIWGHEDRKYAANKFFLFTLAGSLLTFLGLLSIVLWNYHHAGGGVMTFSIPELTRQLAEQPIDAVQRIGPISLSAQVVIFLALFAGFAIKVPLFPLHTWLPLAHVQAPTAGSVVLAGVLLKIGTYGFLRFSIPMLPAASARCAPYILWLSVAGVVYGALVALAQVDMKRMIAYSSVSHLGFCMLGLFALNRLGAEGGMLQMINHGLSTGGLFALVGMLYDRYHTRQIDAYGGIAARLPWFAFFFVLFTFSSIGLPMLNGFAGEFLLLLGTFQRGWSGESIACATELKWISVLAVSGVVLNAWYMLWLVKSVLFGPLREPRHADAHGGQGHDSPVRDLSFRELAALAPLVVFMFWIGWQPRAFIDPMKPSVNEAIAAAEADFETIWHETRTPTVAATAIRQSAAGPGVAGEVLKPKEVARVR